jgi:hypothetical protein
VDKYIYINADAKSIKEYRHPIRLQYGLLNTAIPYLSPTIAIYHSFKAKANITKFILLDLTYKLV